MGCRCNERRAAIVVGVKAIGSGSVKAAQEQARFIASTMVQDARHAVGTLSSRISAAKQRLGRR